MIRKRAVCKGCLNYVHRKESFLGELIQMILRFLKIWEN